jgi:hypothetical protein
VNSFYLRRRSLRASTHFEGETTRGVSCLLGVAVGISFSPCAPVKTGEV